MYLQSRGKCGKYGADGSFYRATYKKSGNAAKSAQKASQKLANGSAASDIRGSEKSKVCCRSSAAQLKADM